MIQHTTYNYQLATDSFTDSPFDILDINATLSDGSDLPAWLSFDVVSLTFSGTPTTADSAILDIVVTANDREGLTAAIDFNLNVGNVVLPNVAPVVDNAIIDQAARADINFSFILPENTYTDINQGDTLSYTAALANGDPLPAWLSFDDTTGTFSGIPTAGDVGTLDVSVTATDSGGLSVSDIFNLNVDSGNVAPIGIEDFAQLSVESPDLNGEFRVNNETAGSQSEPSVAALSNGNVVLVWTTNDSNGSGIVRKIIDGNGDTVRSEVLVNTNQSFDQNDADVTALNDGSFVVTWTRELTGSDKEIAGQLFDTNGNKAGSEFLINTTSANDQNEPAIAALNDGGFVVTWSSSLPNGVYGQRYDNTGSKAGSEFVILANNFIRDFQPAVTGLNDGSFVVAYTAEGVFDSEIFIQRFTANGTKIGVETQANTGIFESQYEPSITALAGGGFVVVWNDELDGIIGQRFDANGNKVGADFRANTSSIDFEDNINPSVTALDNGGFVVSWAVLDVDGDGKGIARRHYNASGNPVSSELQVNRLTQGHQQNAASATLSNGGFIIAWESNDAFNGDNSGSSIAARLFNSDTPNLITVDVLANDFDSDVGDDASSFILLTVSLQGSNGSVSIVNNQVVFDAGNDFDGLTAGELEPVVIDYTFSDVLGEVASSTLSIDLRGTGFIQETTLDNYTILEHGGNSVSSAGDVNGDGFADIIIGDLNGEKSYVVFGNEQGIAGTVDLTSLDGSDGFIIQNSEYGALPGQLGISVGGIGDVNNDGFDDIIVGAPITSTVNGTTSGSSYVVYGKNGGFASSIDVSSLDGSNGFHIDGLSGNDRLGIAVGSAGDVNNDGIDDFIIGANQASSVNGQDSGVSYVLFGSNTGFNSSIDLTTLNGVNGFTINGENAFNFSGNAVSTVGDINGDGIDDLIIGAPTDNNHGQNQVGKAYVVFGSDSGFSATVDLANLDGSNGFQLIDSNPSEYGGDRLGTSVSSAGDINGDGINDLIIGSPGSRIDGVNNAGQSYIVFGRDDGFSSSIDVENLNGVDGFAVNFSEYGLSGTSVSAAGDVNADGFDDLIIGSEIATLGSANEAGASHIIFGHDGGFAPSLNLNTLNGSTGFSLFGVTEDGRAGGAVSGVGDINNDGFDDFIIGARNSGSTNSGESILVYGQDYQNIYEVLGTNADDVIDVKEDNLDVFSGSGNDTINVIGVNNTRINIGPGVTTINIGASSSSGFSRTTIRNSSRRRSGGSNRSGAFSGIAGSINIASGTNLTVRDVLLRRGSLIVSIGDDVELRFEDVDVNNLFAGEALFESLNINGNLSFTYESLLEQGFDIDGTSGDDDLEGSETTDRINGFEGNDDIKSGDGDDTLTGGEGEDTLDAGSNNDLLIGGTDNDSLIGGAGDDTYLINSGDGLDSISDASGTDKIVFGAGLSVTDLDVSQSGDNLILSLGAEQNITIQNWFTDTDNQIEQFIFTDNNVLSLTNSDIENLIGGNSINLAPGVNTGLENQLINEDAPFSYAIADDAFIDPDSIDTLTYSATLSNGDALPDWLSFDAQSKTFSGLADNNNVGEWEVDVTANDNEGASVSDVFRFIVENTNDAPVLQNALLDQNIDQEESFSFNVPNNSFSDDDSIHGDQLSFSASLSNGSVLPSWLLFDALIQTFSGTPGATDVGSFDIEVTANDNDNESISDTFTFTVNSTSTGNVIDGTNSSNVINGTSGNDIINGLGGHDTINGLEGNDVIIGGTGQDTLNGGAGDDTFQISGTDTHYDKFNGGDGIDTILGSDGDDTIRVHQYRNDDTVEIIDGGVGTNVIAGNNSSNIIDVSNTQLINIAAIDGGAGHDTITGNDDNNIIIGGTGQDTLDGGAGDDTFQISGTDTHYDKFTGGAGIDTILGSNGDDTIRVHQYRNDDTVEIIDGGLGNNIIAGNNSSNIIDVSNTQMLNISAIDGGAGHDTITGNDDNNIIIGGTGQDTLNGGAGDDTFQISGTDSHYDKFNGGAGVDTILGSDGDDTIRVHQYRNDDTVEIIDGGLGNNIIAGNNSSNIIDVSNTQLINIAAIDGGAGHDTITGNDDNNIIIGGTGQDTLNGGAGDDTFQISGTDTHYDKFTGGAGIDTILGSNGNDTIRVHQYRNDDTVEIIDGGLGNNTIAGNNSSNIIDVSNTQLINIAAIDGGAGHDTITGNDDNNIIIGGTGQDTLNGGAGDDTYQYALGDSIDTIFDSAGNSDSVLFNNVAHDQLWFWQSGDDLRIGIVNTSDRLTIQDWFSNPNAKIENFNTSDDDFALLESNVQQLVDAMATFTALSSGSLDVPQNIQDDIQSVITTSWQAA